MHVSPKNLHTWQRYIGKEAPNLQSLGKCKCKAKLYVITDPLKCLFMIEMLSFGKDMEQMKFSYIFTVNANQEDEIPNFL